MKTVCIQIGNSDDKLSQRQWSEFVRHVGVEIGSRVKEQHFSGGSGCAELWQNYCWIVNIDESAMAEMFEALQYVRKRYHQDSIAVTIGDTQFMEGNQGSKMTELERTIAQPLEDGVIPGLTEGLQLTTREAVEIKHSLFYYNECGHGTVGHNMLVLIAKMAMHMGFLLEYNGGSESNSPFIELIVPAGVQVEPPAPPSKQ